jgi:DHA2 family methylenomycin A resistance protein-like MFS transporter
MTRTRPSAAGLLAAFLGTFIALLDLTIVNVALPTMQTRLGTDLTGVQWIVDSFALCLAALLLSGGLLGDRLGRKRSYLTAIGVFVAGSVLCAVAGGIGVLIAGRVVQGIAAAVIVPGALSLIGRSTTDPAVRGRLMGWWGMVASLAVVAGPLLGGLLVDSLGWPAIFLVNIPIGAAAIVAGVLGLAESSDPGHASFDPLGQLFGALALGALAYGAIETRDVSAHAVGIGAATVVFAVSVCGFVLSERRVARPMLPLPLFGIRQFRAVTAASVALGFGANGAFFLITLYLQQVRGNSALMTGLLLLPMTVAIMPASVLAGRLTARRGPRLPMMVGYGLTGISLVGLAFLTTGTPYPLIGVLFVICGVGQGLAIVPAPAAILAVVPRQRSGVGSAAVSAARQSGTALGFAGLGAIVNGAIVNAHVTQIGVTRRAEAFVAGMHVSLAIAAAAILAAALGLALLRSRPIANPEPGTARLTADRAG